MRHIVQDSLQSLNGQDMLRMTMKDVPFFPAPTTIYWSSVYMGLYRYLAENNLNVLLTGSGGDEWIGVHDAIAADYVGKFAITPLKHMIDTWRTMYWPELQPGEQTDYLGRRFAENASLRSKLCCSQQRPRSKLEPRFAAPFPIG